MFKEETSKKSHDIYDVSAARTGAGIRKEPLSRCVFSRGTSNES